MIQIDMPMPESCVECRFSQGGYMYCHAMPENFCGYVNYCEEDGKPEWCPLKAQEARVMTVDEISTLANGDVVWVEFSDGRLMPMMVEDGCLMRWRFLWRICEDAFCDEDYKARAWTSRPADEQREAIPWN